MKLFLALTCLIVFAQCELPKVTNVRVSLLDPLGVLVEWDLVSLGYMGVISGYKVKIWSIEEETTRNFKLLNGEQYPGLEQNDVAKEPFRSDYLSQGDVSEITNKNAYHNAVRVKNILRNKLYEIRVACFKGEEIGPMTDPVRVKIVKSKTDYTMSEDVVKPRPVYNVFAMRQLDLCGVSIVTNSTDGEPFIHNSYL